MPRTFQGRLTLGFISVVALTLLLVGPAVILRLDDYFFQQEQQNLDSRAGATATVVALLAQPPDGGQVVTADGHLSDRTAALFSASTVQAIADKIAQADVLIEFGTPTLTADGLVIGVADGGTFSGRLQVPPKKGQARDSISTAPAKRLFTTADPQSGVQVTLSDPYTTRASTLTQVTGLFIVFGLIAFIVAVIVAAFLARRFTTPLRRLTTAARDLEQGELGSRVPTRLAATGAIEISELSRQFNAMADRLEESVAIIRRDRDRSRDFLADVSHELRTPITALRMSNELLSEAAGDDPETRAEFLESSRQQLERLDWLALNLLELSKLDSGLVLLDLRPDDLRAAVESSVEQARASAARRGLSLGLTLPRNPVRVRHDPQRIGQVVTNLVGNALKFTPRGGSVQVDLEATPEGARIMVKDTGVGIDASELPRIFDRFYRGTQANEARGSGSGLGLAIVKSIVDLHAGRVAVDSQRGTGTTFTVSLPRDPRAVEGMTLQPPLGAPAGAVLDPRAGGTTGGAAAGPAPGMTGTALTEPGQVADSSPSAAS